MTQEVCRDKLHTIDTVLPLKIRGLPFELDLFIHFNIYIAS